MKRRGSEPARAAVPRSRRGGRDEPLRRRAGGRRRHSSKVCPTQRAPLAERMRPRSLEEYSGQEHLLGPGKPLRVQIERDDRRAR